MTVEDKRGGSPSGDGDRDRFPVGMRVLAVDDDPICLKVLENLLRKCQYQVTIANQAVLALKMLRENRNKFDLVISDVNMPDIDGFKLLELVGLEMDLPVIMLSAHSDTRLVMKGITHGACDYLLKPVRIEELKNIWQHVIRRKKLDSKDQNKSPNQKEACRGNGEGGQGATSTGNTDQNGKLNRKRKDQNGDEEEDDDENGHEDDDGSTQKKPRVVWSVDLHGKFVASVNQLGLEKAVPKKILDLMNVEGLTRENVASHLQKYRLGLKRLSSQQANIVAAFGNKDSSFLRTGSPDGFGAFHSLATTGRLSNNALSLFPSAGMLGRLNCSTGLSLRAITSSGLIQPGHSQNLSNPIDTVGKLQSVGLPRNQSVGLFQGIPTSLEHNQLQQSESTAHNIIGEFNLLNDPTSFTTTTSFPDASMTVGSSGNSLTSAPSNSLLFHGIPQQIQSRGGFSKQSLSVASLNPDSIEMGVSGSSNFLDHGRCNGSWQSAVQLSKYSSNSLPPSEPFSHDQLPGNNFRNSVSSSSPRIQNSPISFPFSVTISAHMEDSRQNLQCQEGLIDDVVWSMSYAPKQRWEEHIQDYNNLNHTFSTINSLVSANEAVESLSHSMVQNNALSSQRIDVRLLGQLNGGSPSILQHGEVEKFSTDMTMRSNEDCLFEQTKSQEGFVQNSYDLMTAMIKREQNEDILMDGEFGFDAPSLASIQDFHCC